MTFRDLRCFGAVLALFGCLHCNRAFSADDAPAASQPPNIVLILTDDQGYGDLGCYGARGFKTPNLDRMAAEGVRFTDFYVPQAICGASRAALLTGCYPNRIGMLGAPGPGATHGIHPDEMLISELVKQKNYATAAIGKWHLGHHPPFLPLKNGFDSYYGLPYSNDMWPYHPETKAFPPLPLIEGDQVINPDVRSDDQVHLTTSYTERAVKFIDDHAKQPFFLYVAHSMPHVPLHVSDKFRGKSEQGLYGDVIMEIDWSVGEILEALKRNGVEESTLVIFMTDNGPWLTYGNHAGSAGPLREGKGTSWDGGIRVPCLMRWPGRIPAGAVCKEPAISMDIFPTIAGLTGAKLPDHPIDGLDIWPLATAGAYAKSPHEALVFYADNALQAIRSGDWVLHYPHAYRTLDGPAGKDGTPSKYKEAKTEMVLFNLRDDIGETHDVKEQNPEVSARLQMLAEKARVELGDSFMNRKGKGFRPPMKWTPVAPAATPQSKP